MNQTKYYVQKSALPHPHIIHPLEFDLEIELQLHPRNNPAIDAKLRTWQILVKHKKATHSQLSRKNYKNNTSHRSKYIDREELSHAQITFNLLLANGKLSRLNRKTAQ